MQAQSMVDAGEEVSAEVMSRLLKLKMQAARDEFIEARAAEQRAREAEAEAKVAFQQGEIPRVAFPSSTTYRMKLVLVENTPEIQD